MSTKKETVVRVEKSFKNGSETDIEKTLAVREFVTEPAVVGLTYGITINLGNFNSVRLSVSLNMPCYKEEVDDAYAWASEWVGTKVSSERDEILKASR